MSDLAVSQKAQNLARIRDNQRRSRARRKEYLQELEAKLRGLEQAGIEASSEIQSAARKVLDENRKLRALLHDRGVTESEVVAVLGGAPDRSFDQVSTAPALNAMLERRMPCNVLSSTSSPQHPLPRAASMPRQVPSVPPLSIPAQRPTLSCGDSPSPGSIVSSMGTPPPVSYPASYYSAPMTPPAPEIKAEEVRYGYPYEQPYHQPWNYTNEYNLVPDHASYYNTSSCVDAANIIRTMRTDVGMPNQNCYINNNVVFSMMGKYSNQNTAI